MHWVTCLKSELMEQAGFKSGECLTPRPAGWFFPFQHSASWASHLTVTSFWTLTTSPYSFSSTSTRNKLWNEKGKAFPCPFSLLFSLSLPPSPSLASLSWQKWTEIFQDQEAWFFFSSQKKEIFHSLSVCFFPFHSLFKEKTNATFSWSCPSC